MSLIVGVVNTPVCCQQPGDAVSVAVGVGVGVGSFFTSSRLQRSSTVCLTEAAGFSLLLL